MSFILFAGIAGAQRAAIITNMKDHHMEESRQQNPGARKNFLISDFTTAEVQPVHKKAAHH